MLLCCFKDAKGDKDSAPYGSANAPAKRRGKSAKNETAPLAREQKRLIKQRSRDSLRRQSGECEPASRDNSPQHITSNGQQQQQVEVRAIVTSGASSNRDGGKLDELFWD